MVRRPTATCAGEFTGTHSIAYRKAAMNGLINYRRYAAPLMLLVLSALAAGCSGSRGPILGVGANAQLPPTVTASTPINQSTGIVGDPAITATFSEAMAPLSPADFTLTCAAPCTNPTGTVTLDASGAIASFTLSAGTSLEPLTLYTATVSGATSMASGLPLQAPYVWSFTTAAGPSVTAVSPANLSTGVAINIKTVSAAFSEPMAPLTSAASFTLTCAAPCTDPAGTTLSFDSTNTIALLTLPATTSLSPLTLYTATVGGVTSLATGLGLANPYVWHFTTGATADTTRPAVTLTDPATTSPGPTTGVPANSAITAVFTEDMNPATISATSFTVTCAAPCVSPTGTVSYAVGTRTAQFTPDALLSIGPTYTATITTAATDIAGNALGGNQAALPAASDYVWTFTAAAVVANGNVSVQSTNPAAGATTVCPSATINATFIVPSGLRMDPTTVTSANFTVTGPSPNLTPVLASSVVLDTATGRIATFTPATALTPGLTYTALVRGGANGVKDLAVPANTMAANVSWSFTVVPATGQCLQGPALGAASTFGDIGGTAGMTNQGTLTVINGDIGTTAVSTAVTGFHDTTPQCIYTETGSNVGTVNGTIYTAAPPPTVGCPTEGTAQTFLVASQAAAAALTAYNALVAQPAGPDPGAGNLATLVLPPGVYTAAAGTFMIQGGNLTLDAQGNANAVWVFQMAQTLTVGGPGAAFPQSVLLINGAQAKNVFWQVGSHATIDAAGGGTFAGTVISQSGASVSTAGNTTVVTINGRLLSLGASVTLVDTVVNVPAP
jgi:Ice-binding-like/Bacterial Ig-like domain